MDLDTAINKIEVAATILIRFDPKEFENSEDWLTHDIGLLIQNECKKVREFLKGGD